MRGRENEREREREGGWQRERGWHREREREREMSTICNKNRGREINRNIDR